MRIVSAVAAGVCGLSALTAVRRGRLAQGPIARHRGVNDPSRIRREVCRRHHRRFHGGGWTMELDESGEARFYRPDGSLMPDLPEPPTAPDEPAGALAGRHDALGIAIDAWTATPDWDGDRLDTDWPCPCSGRRRAAGDVSAETPEKPTKGANSPASQGLMTPCVSSPFAPA